MSISDAPQSTVLLDVPRSDANGEIESQVTSGDSHANPARTRWASNGGSEKRGNGDVSHYEQSTGECLHQES